MNSDNPDTLALIAGNGIYPLLLARSAKQQGVRRLVAVAFKGETDRAIERAADEVRWVRLGRLQELLDTLAASGARHAVMAGQLTPTALFHVRLDSRAIALLGRLKERNAESIFGAVGTALAELGIELLPAYQFMEANMAPEGLLGRRAPTERERADIALGLKVAKTLSQLDVGQTVVLREGTILAVEAFEGTNEAIRRGGRLAGRGAVIVKVAKHRHDMRFDIPVVGMKTMKRLQKARAAVLAVEAGRTILLEKERLIREADRLSISLIGVTAPAEKA